MDLNTYNKSIFLNNYKQYRTIIKIKNKRKLEKKLFYSE